tara:strand:+ start:1152 stop:1829 length:678 start_codon:yes stop_codon:yes gene_type:complete
MSTYQDIAKYKKSFDFITNNFHYPIAIFLCSLISNSFLTPNHLTLIAVIIEISAVALIFLNFHDYSILIVILLQLGWIFDLMDGMLARYKKIGYYNIKNPSLKGYYFDAVSDHVLKFIILGTLSYQYSLQNQNGLIIGLIVIIIHGVTQIEYTLRQMIISVGNKQRLNVNNSSKVDQIILLMNNYYLFYLVFIPINRIDLLLISLGICEFILLVKRSIQFSFSNV